MKKIISLVAILVFMLSGCSNSEEVIAEANKAIDKFEESFSKMKSYEYNEEVVNNLDGTLYRETQIYNSKTKKLTVTYFEQDITKDNNYKMTLVTVYNKEGKIISYKATKDGKDITKNKAIRKNNVLSYEEELDRVSYLLEQVDFFTNNSEFNVTKDPENFYSVSGVLASGEVLSESYDNESKYITSEASDSKTMTTFSLEFK